MASDSRVSGSEDARTPDLDPQDAADPKANPQPPVARGEEPEREDAKRSQSQRPAKPRKGRSPKPTAEGPSTEKENRSDAAPASRQDTKADKQVKKDGKKKHHKPPAAATVDHNDTKPPPGTAAGGDDRPPPDDAGGAQAEPQRESLFAHLAANRFLLLNAVPSWMVSMMIHAALLMVLALWTLPDSPREEQIVAIADQNLPEDVEELPNEEIDPLDVEVFEGQMPADTVDTRTTTAELDVPSMDDLSAAPEQIRLEDFGDFSDLSEALMDSIGGGMGTGLGEVRGAKARRGMVEKYGGSAGSEAAVAAALQWIAEHQMRDGGWDFDHTKGPCKGRCTHPGTIPPARNGATAMALLPFLGAGQTHKEGKYKETVDRGLAYLVRSMKLGNSMGDLTDAGGRMYSHGLASIALCEAYAMTNDPALLQPAQLSLNFIVYAQDPIGGGWRYRPHQAGDTSVVGWQLMACKSGHMAYLKVPRKTILGATKFLDFVQMDDGAKYGYTVPSEGPGTTAVGLLCRMYLGWKHDNPSLKAGVEYLHRMGPKDNNMYYNYYATQVMRHYGGQFWEEWNAKMRDQLVNSQETKGHAKGSWFMTRGAHADRGGRLYCTSMATMILEVYYRHMPIYGQQAAEEEFPL